MEEQDDQTLQSLHDAIVETLEFISPIDIMRFVTDVLAHHCQEDDIDEVVDGMKES